jgi:hypothetical protein
MQLRTFSSLILALLTVSLRAQASDWYPIDTARFWVYSTPDGGSYSGTVEAPESFAGSLVQPLQWNPGTRELLSKDEAGRVFLHGLNGAPDGSYVVFDPPILRMHSQLTLGQEWEASYDVVHYNAGGVEVGRQQGHETFLVIDFGSVDVPAGTFPAAEVLRTRDLDSLPSYTFRDMYAQGVGWIRRTDENGTAVLFELESYGPGSVPTDNSTWGAVKSLYSN